MLLKPERSLYHVKQVDAVINGHEFVFDRKTDIKIISQKLISQGANSRVLFVRFYLKKDPKKRIYHMAKRVASTERCSIFEEKKTRERYWEESVFSYRVWKLARQAGIPTYTTFRVDPNKGEVYQTILIDGDYVAISSNNPLPKQFAKENIGKFIIPDFGAILQELADFAIKADRVGMQLDFDSLFMMLPQNGNKRLIIEKQLTKPMFFLGDFNCIRLNRDNSLINSFNGLLEGLMYIIERIVFPSDKDKYIEQIKQLLKTRDDGCFFTSKGKTVFWKDYDINKHGQILQHSRYIFSKNERITLGDIERANVLADKIVFDLTNVPQEIKNQINLWNGDLWDYSLEIVYPMLREVKGFMHCPRKKARRIFLPNLEKCRRLYVCFDQYAEMKIAQGLGVTKMTCC